MSEPILRPVEPLDIESVMALQASRPSLPQWTRQHFEHELSSERSYFCVLSQDGAVLGYGGLGLVPPEAQVHVVAVREDHAGLGLGSKILRQLEEHAGRRGCALMTLEVGENNSQALRLYRGQGYCVVGRRAKYYNDGSDALLMDKHLPEK